ncbi:hypothetical protein BU14_2938s0001 [Porphyra umbilicalis]|uniref:Uncharacterized protein n=1 Tax=Porphyra umbilicalis TaxID=2786 RepID=A0A1X6NIJ6_PORUM|nr:hypothetical protein BU14_2938s0001 [Porphyra umbilicalis]|eukprot:OSX68360.1 hypothetical protein BU14_2938s0001 [Porphyra umbilicalis]
MPTRARCSPPTSPPPRRWAGTLPSRPTSWPPALRPKPTSSSPSPRRSSPSTRRRRCSRCSSRLARPWAPPPSWRRRPRRGMRASTTCRQLGRASGCSGGWPWTPSPCRTSATWRGRATFT